MHAWVKDGRIHFVLPEDSNPEEMGKIYPVSWLDHQNLEEIRLAARQAQRAVETYERRLAAKLIKEYGE